MGKYLIPSLVGSSITLMVFLFFPEVRNTILIPVFFFISMVLAATIFVMAAVYPDLLVGTSKKERGE